MVAIDGKLEALRRTRSDYDAEALHHRFLLDAYAGAGGFQGKVRQTDRGFWGWAAEVYGKDSIASSLTEALTEPFTYLDRFPREDLDKFRRRVDVAHFSNYVAPILDLYVSSVNKRELLREGLPDALVEWQLDVDGRGTTWEELTNETIRPRVTLLGWAPVLLDRPAAPADELTRARELDLRLAPRAIPLFPANLLDFDLDDLGAFAWAKIRLDFYERRDRDGNPDPLGEGVYVEEYRVLWPDRVEWYRVERSRGDGIGEIVDEGEYPHGFGEVPLPVFRAKPTPADPVRGISLVHDVAIENRRHFNLLSELDEHLRGQVFASLVIPTKNPEKIGEIVGGPENALIIDPESTRGYEYICPPGTPAAAYETRLEATVREIYRMARVEFSRPTGGVTSGAAHAYQFESTNRRLGDLAQSFARGDAWVLQLVANDLGVGEAYRADATVTAPVDFRVEDLAAELKVALDAVGLGLSPTAEMVLRRRTIEKLFPNLPDSLVEEIEDELETARASALNAEAQLRASLDAAAVPDEDTPDDDDEEGEGDEDADPPPPGRNRTP